jgi:hypothetical protein
MFNFVLPVKRELFSPNIGRLVIFHTFSILLVDDRLEDSVDTVLGRRIGDKTFEPETRRRDLYYTETETRRCHFSRPRTQPWRTVMETPAELVIGVRHKTSESSAAEQSRRHSTASN